MRSRIEIAEILALSCEVVFKVICPLLFAGDTPHARSHQPRFPPAPFPQSLPFLGQCCLAPPRPASIRATPLSRKSGRGSRSPLSARGRSPQEPGYRWTGRRDLTPTPTTPDPNTVRFSLDRFQFRSDRAEPVEAQYRSSTSSELTVLQSSQVSKAVTASDLTGLSQNSIYWSDTANLVHYVGWARPNTRGLAAFLMHNFRRVAPLLLRYGNCL